MMVTVLSRAVEQLNVASLTLYCLYAVLLIVTVILWADEWWWRWSAKSRSFGQ